jgi:hypothetical protein
MLSAFKLQHQSKVRYNINHIMLCCLHWLRWLPVVQAARLARCHSPFWTIQSIKTMLVSTTLSICSVLTLLACRTGVSKTLRPPKVTVRAATSYLDYFNIISLKHDAVPVGCPNTPDYYQSSITRMIDDPNTRNYMAYSGAKLVGCADLITVDAGYHYHIQNVVVHPDNRRNS